MTSIMPPVGSMALDESFVTDPKSPNLNPNGNSLLNLQEDVNGSLVEGSRLELILDRPRNIYETEI